MSDFVIFIADDQENWDDIFLHAVAAHNNNVSRGTGLASNEVHIDWQISQVTHDYI